MKTDTIRIPFTWVLEIDESQPTRGDFRNSSQETCIITPNELIRPSTYYTRALRGDIQTKKETDTDGESHKTQVNEAEITIATQDSKTDNETKMERTNEIERNIETLAYKKVANKTRPIATTLPKEFRIVRRIPSDPLVMSESCK
jgi:hypothetical protein